MKTIHANSVCSHAKFIGHGTRRRQCSSCGKTWTVRKRKRGRKRLRAVKDVVRRFLSGKTVCTTSRHLRSSRDLFLRTTPWPEIAHIRTPCILIVDALHIRTSKYTAVIHLVFVKPLNEERAYVLPMYIDPRVENKKSWHEAFQTSIPPSLRPCIQGLVCDGKSGLPQLAYDEGWLVQRCQFHLIARLQLKRSKYALSRHRKEGVKLYELTKTVCTTRSRNRLARALLSLSRIVRMERNRYLKTILSGFVKHYRDYRTFLIYPELVLPTTTNAVECVNSLIRDLLHRMRGCRNVSSTLLWIEALLKHRRFVNVKTYRI